MRPVLIVGVLVFLSAVTVAQQMVTLAPGESATVTCLGQTLSVTQPETLRALLSCVPAPPPPPGQPAPLPTGDSDAMRYWHQPASHDGLNVHEHGDQPPAWVTDWSLANLGSSQLFGWQPVMTNGENVMKHQAYKGALGTIGPFTVYLLVHAQSNPLDWMAPYHSLRMWVRDGSGGISYRQGRIWFGWTDVRSHRLSRGEEVRDSRYPGWPGRGSFALSCISRSDGPEYAMTEQWYGMMGYYGPDIGISIGRNAAFCQPDDMPTMDEAMDLATWDLTGYHGTNRRFEVSWYGPESSASRSRFIGWWCYQIQPSEPPHTHTSMPQWSAYSPADAPNTCAGGFAPQYTAPTMPLSGIDYRLGNAFDRRYPATGLQQPQ